MGSPIWYIGLTVAFALVLVVVACVAAILNLARRISGQACELAVSLRETAGNTDVLHVIPTVNEMVGTAYDAIRAVRTKTFEGKRP